MVASRPEDALAPSFSFLYREGQTDGTDSYKTLKSLPNTKTDRGIAFLGADSGFLPPNPITSLPKPYDSWQNAATQLRTVIEDNSWSKLSDQVPHLSCNDLSDKYLPLANLCLGTIAHGFAQIANMDVPSKIMDPWTEIASRLGATIIGLPYLHMVCFNFKSTLPEGQKTTAHPQEFTHMNYNPLLTLTGSTTDINMWRGTFGVEYACQAIPGRVARVQQAVASANNNDIRKELIGLVKDLERMTTAFLSIECRHYSDQFVDQVEFARIINAVARPLVPGENVASGTQSPTVHLMDAFFASNASEARVTKSIQDEGKYFPKLHIQFLNSVRKISTLEYIESLNCSQEKLELLHLYSRTLESFAGESGYLGVHLRRLYGFTEIGIKIGRVRSASGLPFSDWRGKGYQQVDRVMRLSRAQRMERSSTLYHSVNVVSSAPKKVGNVLSFDTNGCLIYEPGDVIAILPENNDSLIMDMVQALQLHVSDEVDVHTKAWLKALEDRGFGDIHHNDDKDTVRIPIVSFLKFAELKMTKGLYNRLIGNINANFTMDAIEEWEAIYLPAFLRMLFKTHKNRESLLHILESIFEPLHARNYSIASSMKDSPRFIEAIVGKVQQREWNPALLASCNAVQKKSSPVSYKEESSKKSPSTILSTTTDEPEVVHVLPGSVARAPQTRLLQGVSSSFLSSRTGGDIVRAQILPEYRFRLPKDPTLPIIMICLGTGVAPFVSFLRELMYEKKTLGTTRNAWLIVGARSPDTVPFLEEIEKAVCVEKVARASFSFSRVDVNYCYDESAESFSFSKGSRSHVQDMFKGNSPALHTFSEMVLEGSHIYTCGKPVLEMLVQDVVCRSAQQFGAEKLRSVFSNWGEMNLVEMSKEYINVLSAAARVHISSYNSGRIESFEKEFNPSEIARHRTMNSAFYIFNQSVYDFTHFLQLHPGGAKILIDKAGRDMTSDFNIAHGQDPIPVTASMEPYKIGELNQFSGGCIGMRSFMWEWSVPLLHEILEFRSVFMLDVNIFPELETGDHIEWKSHVSSQTGMMGLTKKFWNVHEDELFRALMDAIGASKLGDALKKLDVKLERTIDYKKLEEELSSIREYSISKAHEDGVSMSREECKEFFRKGREFLNIIVDCIADMQREVEHGLEMSQDVKPTPESLHSMVVALVRVLKNGILHAYNHLPTDRFLST